VNQIPPARRQLLLRNRDPEILARAQKLFGDGASSPRKDVIEKYKPALSLTGDAARGQKVYETICAACHRLGNKGNDIGPNLASVHQWSPEQILVNVLDPNREVAPNYIQYVFELKDGQTVVGLISDETPTSITLRRADNGQQTLLRQNISTMTSLGISLMPEGLEQAVSVQQMADLIALITGSP
jgi:putative heme-binding domain-containing protein